MKDRANEARSVSTERPDRQCDLANLIVFHKCIKGHYKWLSVEKMCPLSTQASTQTAVTAECRKNRYIRKKSEMKHTEMLIIFVTGTGIMSVPFIFQKLTSGCSYRFQSEKTEVR